MAKAHEQGWEVGQTVYVTFHQRYSGQNYKDTITKVGRKWITVGEGYRAERFDAETRQLDAKGHSSRGQVWPSEAEYIESTEIEKAWRDLVSRLPYRAPKGMTLADVQKMKETVWGDGDGRNNA